MKINRMMCCCFGVESCASFVMNSAELMHHAAMELIRNAAKPVEVHT